MSRSPGLGNRGFLLGWCRDDQVTAFRSVQRFEVFASLGAGWRNFGNPPYLPMKVYALRDTWL